MLPKFHGGAITRHADDLDVLEIYLDIAGLGQTLAGRRNQRVIIVGHGGIFTFTLKDICRNIELEAIMHQPSRNCSITELELDEHGADGRALLKVWAYHAHIVGDAMTQIIGHPAFDK